MTFREVVLSIDGLRDRDEMLEEWARRSTMIIAASNFNGKAVMAKFNNLWPRRNNEKPKVPERALEQLKKFREAEALKRAKTKLDGRRP